MSGDKGDVTIQWTLTPAEGRSFSFDPDVLVPEDAVEATVYPHGDPGPNTNEFFFSPSSGYANLVIEVIENGENLWEYRSGIVYDEVKRSGSSENEFSFLE